ncbi:membrane protein [Pseudomonas putida S11]|nr:membrane protein [Pseudomonas putida S11]
MAPTHQRIRTLPPGVVVSLIVGAAASFLSEHYAAPVMLFALLLGMALNFLAVDGPCKAGIEFTARTVLRLGVALLGMRITLDQIASLGWKPVALVVTLVVVTILVSVVVAKALGFSRLFGMLTGGATAICGASAALALAAALPQQPAQGACNAVYRDRRVGAVDPGDDPLPDDCPVAAPVPSAGRGLPRCDHPRRGAGGGRGLQHVYRDRRHRHRGQADAGGHAVAGHCLRGHDHPAPGPRGRRAAAALVAMVRGRLPAAGVRQQHRLGTRRGAGRYQRPVARLPGGGDQCPGHENPTQGAGLGRGETHCADGGGERVSCAFGAGVDALGGFGLRCVAPVRSSAARAALDLTGTANPSSGAWRP